MYIPRHAKIKLLECFLTLITLIFALMIIWTDYFIFNTIIKDSASSSFTLAVIGSLICFDIMFGWIGMTLAECAENVIRANFDI